MRPLRLPPVLLILVLLPLVPLAAPPPPDLHPIVFGGFLLGGSDRGAWRESAQIAPAIRGGERYKLYSLFRCVGDGIGGAVTHSEPCETGMIEITPEAGAKGDYVALHADWPAIPRIPVALGVESTAYRGAVAAILRANKLPGAPVEIRRILRVDLEGDGTDEVLIQAEHMPAGLSVVRKKGTYSLVLLRRLRRGKVESILLESGFYLKDGQFEDGCPDAYRIHALADLNGDGIMEILTGYRYYEGEGYTVYDPKTLLAVLEVGCGL